MLVNNCVKRNASVDSIITSDSPFLFWIEKTVQAENMVLQPRFCKSVEAGQGLAHLNKPLDSSFEAFSNLHDKLRLIIVSKER